MTEHDKIAAHEAMTKAQATHPNPPDNVTEVAPIVEQHVEHLNNHPVQPVQQTVEVKPTGKDRSKPSHNGQYTR